MARSMESIKAEAQFVARQDFEELMELKPTIDGLLDYLVDIASYRNEITYPEFLEGLVKREINRRINQLRR